MVAIISLAKDIPKNQTLQTIITQQSNSLNPLAVQAWISWRQQTNLSLNHFKIVEDMGLKITESSSSWTAAPANQTGWWYHKPAFIFFKVG
jgi:hypothetical protein